MYSGDENGVITSPRYGMNVGRMYCTYIIRVPKGRRITAELVEGKSIAHKCDDLQKKENQFNEDIMVSEFHFLIFYYRCT